MNRLLLFGFFLLTFAANAQQRTLRGRVLDASTSEPLPGVAISVKGQPKHWTTDATGQFVLSTLAKSTTLTASMVGYVAQTVVLKPGRDILLIQLQPDVRVLNEVVITGYGPSAKRDLTGSVAVLSPSRSRKSEGASATPASSATRMAVTSSAKEVSYRNDEKQAGQLTAGEIHDYSKWTLWQDITKNELREFRTMWQQVPTERYSVQVVAADGFPVIDAPVRLLDTQRQVIWQSRTDNTGRAELWRSDGSANMFRTDNDSTRLVRGKLSVEATVSGQTYTLSKPKLFGKGNNTLTTMQPCAGTSQQVDVAFVVDATGSMGDEIAYLKAELTDVINRAKQAAPNSTIRLGSVFYRDKNDTYLTRYADFQSQADSAVAFIKEQEASGGGDFPEAVDTALAVALTNLTWSQTAKTRLLFLVLDAPPHDDPASVASLQRSVAKAAAMGIRLIPVAASGIDKSTEYLLRSMALGTNGTYVFLTDDSGIGDSHIKPTTDQYTVEKLNALLVRLITKFTLTTDCQPQTLANVPTPPVRYTEEGKPVDTTLTNTPEPTFRYFPNPTRDYLTIENSTAIDELFVMDVTGKVLMREAPRQATTRLDMQPYPTGTYLFRFTAAQDVKSGRFLLNR